MNSQRSFDGYSSSEEESIKVSNGAFSKSRNSSFTRRGSFRSLEFLEPEEMKEKHHRVWELMSSYLSPTVEDIQQFIVNHIEYTLARSRYNLDDFSAYQGAALSLRDRMIENWNDTQQYFTEKAVKRVYYFSIEYLMGRTLGNSITNLQLGDNYSQALKDLGYRLEDLYEQEQDAALGNGGLGRLAACFLDSLATLDYPAWGYGIRYNYGMFHQEIRNGFQVEKPDFWLTRGNPWEICRSDVTYTVRFGGYVNIVQDHNGNDKYIWEGGDLVKALAYDTPIPGFGTQNTLNLRLWSSIPHSEFDLATFNEDDYYGALKARQDSQSISSVLYPNDNNQKGKELRLKQQYFFCSASLRDIIRRFKKLNKPWIEFSDIVAIQLNDTHPVIGVPELLRLFIDEYNLGWDEAWAIVTKTFAFTNHTVLPEALEMWSVDLFESLLPRHLQLIYEINRRHLMTVAERWPEDETKLQQLSIFIDRHTKMIRMAHLAIIASHSVNGVAAIHSEIIKITIFKEFNELSPQKFNNKTNGVTPRRWIAVCNPELSALYTEMLGSSDWIKDLGLLSSLIKYADDEKFQKRFYQIKFNNKTRLRRAIYQATFGEVDPDEHALFDIQVKRIHEYKRQLLNALGVIARYVWIKELSSEERRKVVPRVVVFAGKAAPGYHNAKVIIKLINSISDVVNRDTEIGNLLKVVFIPNYSVSLAEVIVPANDISQHISTAGTEASGTSNMKFAMNGGLIIGTLDGANIEIRDEIGHDNMFIFGATANQVDDIRNSEKGSLDERMYRVMHMIQQGFFGPYSNFKCVIEPLISGHDYYLLGADFRSYMAAQQRIDETYLDRKAWVKKAILSSLSMGKFSSDTTIHAYARDIWNIQPCKVPLAVDRTTHSV